MNSTSSTFPLRTLHQPIYESQTAKTESVATSPSQQKGIANAPRVAATNSVFGKALRARWARMVDTKRVIYPPALRFAAEWSVAAEAICHSWVESQSMHEKSRASLLGLAKMKALEYERKHQDKIPRIQRLLPDASSKNAYYEAEIGAFFEAIGVIDAQAILESFKLAGTGGLHRQHTTVMATVTNAIGATQLLVPDAITMASLAGTRLLLQGLTSGTILQAGTRRLRNAGTEELLPMGRADAAPRAKVAPNVLQASARVIYGLRGAEKNLQAMQAAMDKLEHLQKTSVPNSQAMQAAKIQLELTFAKLCHQLALKSSYKTSSESAKIEFRGNQRYLLTSYVGSSVNFAAGLIAIMTPALIAAPITGGLSVAAVALALALYVGYQLSNGPAKDGEAKAKRAIVALVKLVEVLSGEHLSDMQHRAHAWQTYLTARRQLRFATPAKRIAAKRAAKITLLDQLEKITDEDELKKGLTMQRNWAAYRAWCDAKEALATSAVKGKITNAQHRQQHAELDEKFSNDHATDFALDDIVAAWKSPMQMRMVAAQRLLKGKVARLHARIINSNQKQSAKLRWRINTEKEKTSNKYALRKIQMRQSLCDLFNFELALQDMTPASGTIPENTAFIRASGRMAAIVDKDVRALFCGDGGAQVDAVDKSKRLTAGEAHRYTYINAGAAAIGLTVNTGLSITDTIILEQKAAGTYSGPRYNDYKFLTLSQAQAQPGAHLAVGDRAAFQKREMQPALARIEHTELPLEVVLRLDGDRGRILQLQDSEVDTALAELVDQLANSVAVPQVINLSLAARSLVSTSAKSSPITAVTNRLDQSLLAPHGVAVDLSSTSAFHSAQLKLNSRTQKIAHYAELVSIGGRQALMSIAGLPTQAIAQHQLKKTRASLNTAADGSYDVRSLLHSVAQQQRAAKTCDLIDTLPQVISTPSFSTNNAERSRLLWQRLQKAEELRGVDKTASRKYFSTHVVPTNTTGMRCCDNTQVLKIQDRPIHAHRIGPPQASTDPALAAMTTTYAAGQSPEANRLDEFLLQGIASRQGIFQFVSRMAHHSPERSTETPIIDLLQRRRQDRPAMLIGDRYRIDDFASLEEINSESPSDHRHFILQVTDTKSTQQPVPVIRIPITQAGLKFTNRVLDAAHIRRADALMDAHIDQLPHQGRANADGTLVRPGIDRMVLSRAGIGRNATLITYRTLVARITHADRAEAMTDAALDDALFDVIYAGRSDRDAAYVPSLPQLTALRLALLLRITEQRAAANLPQ